MFKAIQEQITYLYKEKRQPLLLAVDEAQYLNIGILNDKSYDRRPIIGSQQGQKVIDAETIRAAVDNQGLY